MHKFLHHKDGQIEYHEEEGDVWYSYRETKHYSQGSYREYKTEGKVPTNIVSKGKEAIHTYVQEQVYLAVSSQKKRAAAHDAFAKNPDFPVEVRYKGILLKGRIDSASDRYLSVQLQEPYEGESGINFGWASAMVGHFIFDGHGRFSESAIQSAKKLLIQIYEEEEHKRKYADTIDLVDQLNDESD